MKKRFEKGMAFFLCLVMCLALLPATSAEAEEDKEADEIRIIDLLKWLVELSSASDAETVVSVTDFGADGTDREDDYAAFRAAADSALQNEGTTRIMIPAGTYYLSYAVAIYSDTVLEADENAMMVCTGAFLGPMFYGAHTDDSGNECYGESCTHGGYTQTHDVTITGGVWDRNDDGSGNSCALSFRHANRITFQNMTVRNATNHLLNFSGSANILVEDCRLENSVENTSDDSRYWGGWTVGDKGRYDTIEAIHLDICDPVGEDSGRAMPFDGTAVSDVTVRNCTFSNVFSGIGNHHAAPAGRPTRVVVTDNTAEDVRGYFFYAYDFDDFVLSGNTVTRGGALCTVWTSTGLVEGNEYSCNDLSDASDKNAIYLNGGDVTVKDNHVNSANAAGLQLNREAKATCSGNTIRNTKTHGFLVINGSDLTAENNTLSEIGGSGFGLSDGSRAEIRDNTITNTQKHGLYAKTDCEIVFSGNRLNGVLGEGHGICAADNCSLTAENNDLRNLERFGFYVTDSTAVIRGNTIRDTGNEKQAIRTERCPGALIENNTVLSSDQLGIAIKSCNDAKITGNKIANTASHGIHINLSTGVQVWGNTVDSAKTYGLLIEGASDTDYSSAYIFNNYFSSADSYDLRIGKYAKNCILANNTLAHGKASYDKTATYTTQAYLFSDVLDPSRYYYKPVYWAAERGITKGYDDGSFGHDRDCSRAHIVTFLWRLAGKPAPKTTTNPFPDVSSSAYYYKAVLWAVEKGITKGYSDGTFRPDEPCTREQAMTFLWRMAGKPAPKTTTNPFSDVKSSDYFCKAVLWASENGIAKGYSSGEYAGQYGVGLACLREHVVTFLYRYDGAAA